MDTRTVPLANLLSSRKIPEGLDVSKKLKQISSACWPGRLVKALSIDVSHFDKTMRLLDGICPDALEVGKDRQFSLELSRLLWQMRLTSQIECIERMISTKNLTAFYVEAKLIATRAELLLEARKPPKAAGGVT